MHCHSGHKTPALPSYTSLKLDKAFFMSWTHPTDSFRNLKSVGFIYSVVLYFYYSMKVLDNFPKYSTVGFGVFFWGWVLCVYLATVILFINSKKKLYKKLQREWMKKIPSDDAAYWWYTNHFISKQLQLIKFYAIQTAKENVITGSVMINPIQNLT